MMKQVLWLTTGIILGFLCLEGIQTTFDWQGQHTQLLIVPQMLEETPSPPGVSSVRSSNVQPWIPPDRGEPRYTLPIGTR